MKKKLCLCLCLVMLLSALASCSGGSTETETKTNTNTPSESTDTETTPAETEAPKAESTLTITDFGGRDYRMISTNQDNRQVDINATELTGSTLNDLVYNRNFHVMELYNVKMVAEDIEYNKINDMVKKDATSGDTSYDLYLTNYTANALATQGYLYDFYTMPHVNLKNAWWDQNEIADMTIRNKLYMAIGDISPTELLTSECILFNKVLFDTNGIPYPYEDALKGTWTLDKLLTIADGKTTDLNGDGTIDVEDDMFSMTCWYDYGTAMFYGAGGDVSSFDSNGNVTLDIDVEKISNIYNKIFTIINGTKANYETVVANHDRSFRVFSEGRAFFCGITFQKIETFLREMEDDYGVLPNPKYDENQQNYSTCVSGAGSMVVVPKTCTDPEYVGSMLEAMAAVSYDMITPDLINTMASTKNVRDQESSEVVQMIIRNRNFDTARMHDINADKFVEELLPKGSTDVASYFAKNEKSYEKRLDEINKAYQSLDE